MLINKILNKKTLILYLTLILTIPILISCSSPTITNIKSEIIDDNPNNYRTVNTTTITISTTTRPSSDILNQYFESILIEYFDKSGNIITTEMTPTIQDAINQNKTGMTLVTGDGRGKNITYDAEIDGKLESRNYNVPFIAEYNIKNIETESDLKSEIDRNQPTLTYTWDGTSKHIINKIIIKYKEKRNRMKSHYNPNTKRMDTKIVHYDHITEYTYKYDTVLQLINQRTYNS